MDQIKILFLSANPKNITHIRLDEEAREVDERIQLGEFRDHLALISHFAVRPRDLRQSLLRHKPHVLHFSGHGSRTQGIVLEDNSGQTKFVSADALADLLRVIKDNLRVVVLNACYSSLQSEGISQIVDFTIGMQKEIGDRSAIVFSAAFYQGLAHGRSVQESFDLGTNALKLEGIPESETPILLSKKGADPTQTRLVSPVPNKPEPPEPEPLNPSPGGSYGTVNLRETTINGGNTVITGQSTTHNYGTRKR